MYCCIFAIHPMEEKLRETVCLFRGLKKMNKEEIIKALKKAVEHKKELCEQTEAQWAKEGVKGKVICL